jgi:hypothetical protein
LTNAGIGVVARIPCETPPTSHSLVYLRTKKERMSHALSLRHRGDTGPLASGAWRGSDHSGTLDVAHEL